MDGLSATKDNNIREDLQNYTLTGVLLSTVLVFAKEPNIF